MRRYHSIFLCLFILFSASCEDKEKSRNNATSPATTNSVEKDSIRGIDNKVTGIEQGKDEKEEKDKTKDSISQMLPIAQEELIPFLTKYGKENRENRVRIKTRFGNIDVQLYMDTPLHRANFIFLTKQGYFDGTYFHRVAEGFVIQGGNSDNPETAKKRNRIGSYLIPSEFEAGHRHTRGAFSAAKYSHQNVSKASSPFEFFIVQSERGAHHLDNDHTVFGRVTAGMDVVDEIAKQDIGEGEWPLLNIPIEVEILN